MWLILQQNSADDFVIATGESYSIRDFVEKAFKVVDIDIEWRGAGFDEFGVDKKNGKKLVQIDKRFFRPTEVDFLLGNPQKAKKILGWKPKYKLDDLIEEMVEYDMKFDDYGHM